MPTMVPDRGEDPKRKVNFYDAQGKINHSADVRWVGNKFKKPHQGDINKNYKQAGGRRWEVAD